ncbi:MAG: chemotaxis-specific methylesterase [Candidatus Methanolliviera sp. GoM_oil]|nr:MAG: chemotaxis-specific methylesterase [Candidatus Methanolliviera sp. GoM_oil]
MDRDERIKVLVVDDSAFMRVMIKDILERGGIEVLDTARDGYEAVNKADKLMPDVITMDVDMPKMDGIAAVKEIMEKNPRPIIMLSALTTKAASETFKALRYGAIDFIPKPSSSYDIKKIEKELIDKVIAATRIEMSTLRLRSLKGVERGVVKGRWNETDKEISIIIGGSTGGPSAFEQIIPLLPEDIPASIISVQHMPPGNFMDCMARRLDKLSEIGVKVAKNFEFIKRGKVYFAPGGMHLAVSKSSIFKRTDGTSVHKKGSKNMTLYRDDPPLNAVKPSVDITMKSAVSTYGKNTIGVLLTGMGSDGAVGMKEIRACGGRTIACDEETSLIFGMPKAAIELKVVDEIVPLYDIAERIVRNVEIICEE